MGKGADGGGTRPARRHRGSIVAAATGATALATAAAVAGWQRRRRERAITPEDSLAGPPPTRAAPANRDERADRDDPADRDEPAGRDDHANRDLDVATDRRDLADLDDDPAAAPGAASAPAPGPVRSSGAVLPSEAGRVPTPPPDPVPATSHAPPPPSVPMSPARPKVPRAASVVAGLVLVLVVGITAAVLTGGGPDDAEAADPRPASEAAAAARSTTTTTAPVTAADAFAVAAQRLTEAGSFTYTGAADATDVSIARPMLWLAVGTTVEGEVVTSTARLHEVSVAADGSATETVAAASEVWGRRASTAELLADVPLEGLPGLSGSEPAGRGAALLPSWLASAVGSADLGLDDQGRRMFQATIPAATMGVVERDVEPVDATVTLAFDDDGDPVRVEIVSSPDGPPFHLVFDIDGVGDPVVIETPADASTAPLTTP
ncbi:MAG TPA: hypothetical protein VFY82_05105 [Acidimicrobiales bacterium]|nr:hypothetical protein [Acidimicrobiales bacterium]